MERAARSWRWLGIAAVLVFGAVLTGVWLYRPAALPPAPLQDTAERVTVETLVSDSIPSRRVAHDPERAKLEELRTMSETFRNTTFLIAIRDAGYLCDDLASVYGGLGDSTTWTVACREMLAYTVRVTHAGGLHVEPTLQYLDSPFFGDREPSAPPPTPAPQR